jgi:hypothetical protein
MREKQPQFRAVTRGVLTNVQSQPYVTGRAIDTLGPEPPLAPVTARQRTSSKPSFMSYRFDARALRR